MAANQVLIAGQDNVDIVSAYAYPADVLVFQMKSGGSAIHLVISFSAITPSSALAKAPNGSMCVDTQANKFYTKCGTTKGAIDGTWKSATVS